jgi:hypothetical protein
VAVRDNDRGASGFSRKKNVLTQNLALAAKLRHASPTGFATRVPRALDGRVELSPQPRPTWIAKKPLA